MTKKELQAEAERLGLDTSGTKAELESRILAAADEPAGPPDAVSAAVREAEAAGQRWACDVPAGELPQALADALDARVEANLRRTGGKPVQSCGGDDPAVRALEAPYRKPRAAVPGSSAEEQPPSGSLDTPNQEEE